MSAIFVADSGSPTSSVQVFDVATGGLLTQFRPQQAQSDAVAAISLRGNGHLLAASSTKPLCYTWQLQRRDRKPTQFTTPGKVSQISCSPDGEWCAAAAQERLYVWFIRSGDLLSATSLHFQAITKLVWSSDSRNLLTGSRDGQVHIWKLAELVALRSIGDSEPQPAHILASHSLAVTDISVAAGQPTCRVATCSEDRTCAVYDLASGSVLVTITFEAPVTSCCLDLVGQHLYCGLNEGRIGRVQLYEEPVRTERFFKSDESEWFVGHTAAPTHLATTPAGDLLVSAGAEHCVRIWHTRSRQCLRSFTTKGVITALLVSPKWRVLTDDEARPEMKPLQSFKRVVTTEVAILPVMSCNFEAATLSLDCPTHTSPSSRLEFNSTDATISKLQESNQQLYTFCSDRLAAKYGVVNGNDDTMS